MVWRFPPERGGRAPQASRHSNTAEVVAARLALIVEVGGGAGVEGGVAPVSDGAVEQPPTRDAAPALPASASS